MDNKQDKFSNVDDYDLILEEKEKELKKEKRNKRILASSLLLLLLLGSTAVVAPIISVAVNNKNNSANINNIKIPSTLTFTDADITKLINSYKSEIQNKKLSFDEFQTNFINITKQYIFVGNTPIGSIVKSATITQNSPTDDYIINIVLDENKQYLSEQLTLATLNNNELSITLKYSEKTLGDFFNPVDISNKINQLPELIENWIKDNQFTKEEFENAINDGTLKNEIVNWLKPNINSNQIGNIRYEEPNLIIEPKHPDKFSPSDSNLIVDGNIVIPISKFYTLVKFINLNNLFNAINTIIEKVNYDPEGFENYLKDNFDEIKQLIFDNLKIENNNYNLTKDDIEDIILNDNYDLDIKLKEHNYIKYEIEDNENFNPISNNTLTLINLGFIDKESPDSWFIFDGNNKSKIMGLSDEGKKHERIVIPSYVTEFAKFAFQNELNIRYINLSFTKNLYDIGWFMYKCRFVKTIIFPDVVASNFIGIHASYALGDCASLKYVYFPSKLKIRAGQWEANMLFYDCKDVTIYVPNEEIRSYYMSFKFVRGVKEIVVGQPPKN